MPAPKQPYFVYDPLPDPRSHIRLLQLHREKQDGRLQFSLTTTSLSSAPNYFGLSYEWGDPVDTETILVNDTMFFIQQSLHNFLMQIAVHYVRDLPINIWVDAVCIDQDAECSYNCEKNHQIQIMGKIYSTAEKVLMWLGKAELIDQPLSQLIKDWYFAQFPPEETLPVLKTSEPAEFDFGSAGRHFFDCLISMSHTERHDLLQACFLEKLSRFLCQSYWDRLWVFQEITSARMCVALCPPTSSQAGVGTLLDTHELCVVSAFISAVDHAYRKFITEIQAQIGTHISELYQLGLPYRLRSHTQYVLLCQEFWRNFVHKPTGQQWLTIIRHLKQVKHQYPGLLDSHKYDYLAAAISRIKPETLTLENLILHHPDLACFDPLDHVYGLVGLASDVDDTSPFAVDYRCSTVELLIRTVSWYNSEDSIGLSTKLVDALKLRPRASPKAPHSLLACHQWAREFIGTWTSHHQEALSKLVTIELTKSDDIENEELINFNIPMQRRLLSSTSFSFVYQWVNDKLTLAKVKDTSNLCTLGSDSEVTLSLGLLQNVSTPRFAQQCHPEGLDLDIWRMEIAMSDLMYVLTTIIYSEMAHEFSGQITRGNRVYDRGGTHWQ